MPNIYDMIPIEHWIIRKEYLTENLNKAPLIRMGLRGNNKVLRIYERDRHHYREISDKNSKWEETEDVFRSRNQIEQCLTGINIILKTHYHCSGH